MKEVVCMCGYYERILVEDECSRLNLVEGPRIRIMAFTVRSWKEKACMKPSDKVATQIKRAARYCTEAVSFTLDVESDRFEAN